MKTLTLTFLSLIDILTIDDIYIQIINVIYTDSFKSSLFCFLCYDLWYSLI